MVDIVVPLGCESQWQDNELRYALRSFIEYFKEIGHVWVIGKMPEWAVNITCIPFEDNFKRNKDANIIAKLLKACDTEQISEDFIFLSDDQCLLSNCKKGDLFPRYVMDLKEFPFKENQNRWRERLQRTYLKLAEEGKTTYHFDSHHPVLINKKSFRRVALAYNWGVEFEGYTVNTLYFNNVVTKLEPELGIVAKYQTINDYTESYIEMDVEGKMFLTYDDRGLNDSLKSFIQKRFNKISKFEK